MERLTDTPIEDVRNNLDAFDIIDWEEEIFKKLAEYENTGLEPKEVEKLKDGNKKLKNILDVNDNIDYSCMLELLNDMNCKCWADYKKNIENLRQKNNKLKHDLAVRDKALKFAVADKIIFEDFWAEQCLGSGAKITPRKKEQYYLDQAEKELKGE